MRLSERSLLRVSRAVRPFMRRKTPGLYRLCRLVVGLLCPRDVSHRLVVEYDGGLIHVDTATTIGHSLLFRGCHEPEVARLIGRLVQPGHVCLDLGAHIGSHTLVMARAAGAGGRVIAFEPHPQLCSELRRNVALNRLANVTVVRAALAEGDGTADLFGFAPGARNRGISSLVADRDASERIQVRTLSGKSLEERFEIGRLDFVKIDVEGSEQIVLEQLFGLIARDRPCIVFEYQKRHWDKFGGRIESVLSRLRGLGYEGFLYVREDVTSALEGELPGDCDVVCIPGVEEAPLGAGS